MPYEQLNDAGFLFTLAGARVDLLHGDFGDGYRASALIGSPEGLRTWSVKISVLPDGSEQAPLIDGKTRAMYLWDFWFASKAAGNRPFWIEDPRESTAETPV